MKLYIDMDGVLMNYEGAIREAGVVPYPEGAIWISKPRNTWPPEMVAADKAYVECMLRPDFWSGIKPMLDARILWDFCISLQAPMDVLSAAPTDRNGETKFAEIKHLIAQDKRRSIWTYFDPHFPGDAIRICLRHEKASFAEPDAILIDDTPGNCEEWTARGGIAILHTDAITTIRKLKEIFMSDYTHLSPPVRSEGKGPLRPRNSAERKAEPVHTGAMLYFPDAFAAVARVSKKGNVKHNPGEPLGWARHKSTDQTDAVGRHMLTPTAIDADSGELELAHAAWRVLAELQLAEERRLAQAGIMPYSGIDPR